MHTLHILRIYFITWVFLPSHSVKFLSLGILSLGGDRMSFKDAEKLAKERNSGIRTNSDSKSGVSNTEISSQKSIPNKNLLH